MNLKTIALAAFVPAIIGGPANAIELQCGAPRIFQGHIPAPGLRVTAIKASRTDAGWSVYHYLANGSVVSRGDQYNITDVTDRRWIRWTGPYNRNPTQNMVGTILKNGATWQYTEAIFATGNSQWQVAAVSDCQRLDDAPAYAAPPSVATPAVSTSAIPLQNDGHGGFSVNVTVGGIYAHMLLDTGATTVKISRSIADALASSGQIADYQTGKAKLADGRVIDVTYARVRSISVGDKTAYNVEVSIGDDDGMLLGQSFLKSFKSWAINNQTGELTLG